MVPSSQKIKCPHQLLFYRQMDTRLQGHSILNPFAATAALT